MDGTMMEEAVMDAPALEVQTQSAAKEEQRPLPFKVLIIGPSGSGKSTFAALLAERLNAKVGETSTVLMIAAAGLLENLTSCGFAQQSVLPYLCSKNSSARKDLLHIGHLMTQLRPTCLIDVAAKGAEIIVGVRRKIELAAWYDYCHLRDVLIEIEGQDDPHYELKGWSLPQRGFVKFVVPSKDGSWAAKADVIAEDLLAMGAEIYRKA